MLCSSNSRCCEIGRRSADTLQHVQLGTASWDFLIQPRRRTLPGGGAPGDDGRKGAATSARSTGQAGLDGRRVGTTSQRRYAESEHGTAIEGRNGAAIEMDRQRIAHGHLAPCEQSALPRKTTRANKTNRAKSASKVRSEPFIHRVKIAIADAVDQRLDSAVFIKAVTPCP